MKIKEFNPFFYSYAKSNGNEPAQQMAQDEIDYPGGAMTGFILWIAEKKKEFYLESPDSFLNRDVIHDAEAWSEFLERSGK